MLKDRDKLKNDQKKRTVKRSQPKLGPVEICGPKGFMDLKSMFDGYVPDKRKNPVHLSKVFCECMHVGFSLVLREMTNSDVLLTNFIFATLRLIPSNYNREGAFIEGKKILNKIQKKKNLEL